jgi:hypothetical protein
MHDVVRFAQVGMKKVRFEETYDANNDEHRSH